MEEFLNELGIREDGVFAPDGSYVIDIPNAVSYGRYVSILDKSDELEEDTESSQITSGPSSIQYVGEEYTITLLADFDADTYKLVMREN